jgi:ketosteroid isomerase-like protein
MRRFALLALPLLLAAAPAGAQTPYVAAPPPAEVAPVVAAERAFAADSPGLGVTGSFTKWSLPDAVIIAGGQVQTVRQAYPPEAPRPADEPILQWWPNFAGVARSGELGFTTGGVSVGGQRTGHYVTVWKRQDDGAWKWIYDGGSGASAADVPGPETEPVILAPAAAGTPTPEEAIEEVEAAEAVLALAAATDQKAAHLEALADDGRLYVAPLAPAIGREQFAAALDGWPASFTFGPTEGGGSSDAGDLVWTYGQAGWAHDGQERRGHYVRLWQKQADGWRIVLAQLIPAPPPAPPPAPEAPPAGG